MTDPIFFATASVWRAWLEENHADSPGLMVGLVKAGAGLEGIAYADALDEALAFGWIDGVRRSIDERRWMIRFSPRKKGSIWSAVNKRHVERLLSEGRMAPPGIAAFDGRDPAKERSYSFENANAAFTAAEEALFRAAAEAWAWFESRPKSYRHPATWWVVSAKLPETRRKRLETLIADSAAGRKVKPLRRPGEG